MESNFPERIQLLIKKFGRQKLSEMTGISTTQLHRLRGADRDTSRGNLISLWQATGCSLAWLAVGYGEPFPEHEQDVVALPPESAPADNAPTFTPDELEMIQLYRSAPLMLKMQVVQALSSGAIPAGGAEQIKHL